MLPTVHTKTPITILICLTNHRTATTCIVCTIITILAATITITTITLTILLMLIQAISHLCTLECMGIITIIVRCSIPFIQHISTAIITETTTMGTPILTFTITMLVHTTTITNPHIIT